MSTLIRKIKQRIFPKRTLVGICHNEDRIDELTRSIKINDYAIAGIELPSGYKKLEVSGIRTFFFSKLADALEDKKVEIIPLEDPELSEEVREIGTALEILRSEPNPINYLKEKIIEYLTFKKRYSRSEDRFSAPELKSPSLFIERKLSMYLKAYELVIDYSKEQINEMFTDINKKREAHMLKMIDKQNPELIVIGTSHAENLKDKLQKYEYLSV